MGHEPAKKSKLKIEQKTWMFTAIIFSNFSSDFRMHFEEKLETLFVGIYNTRNLFHASANSSQTGHRVRERRRDQ